MSDTLDIGDTVTIPWGLDEVRRTVARTVRTGRPPPRRRYADPRAQ